MKFLNSVVKDMKKMNSKSFKITLLCVFIAGVLTYSFIINIIQIITLII